MFSKTTPHTSLSLEHYQNPQSGLTTVKSNSPGSMFFPILMILVGLAGVVAMMIQNS
jgi:hypothetical protein